VVGRRSGLTVARISTRQQGVLLGGCFEAMHLVMNRKLRMAMARPSRSRGGLTAARNCLERRPAPH